MKVNMKNQFGVIKQQKVGFSWTMFFFGALVYCFRGMWSEFWKCFFLSGITIGIYPLVQCWTGNKKTIAFMLEKGYRPVGEADALILHNNQLMAMDIAKEAIA